MLDLGHENHDFQNVVFQINEPRYKFQKKDDLHRVVWNPICSPAGIFGKKWFLIIFAHTTATKKTQKMRCTNASWENETQEMYPKNKMDQGCPSNFALEISVHQKKRKKQNFLCLSLSIIQWLHYVHKVKTKL